LVTDKTRKTYMVQMAARREAQVAHKIHGPRDTESEAGALETGELVGEAVVVAVGAAVPAEGLVGALVAAATGTGVTPLVDSTAFMA
jgi:hypothetical protein